MPTASRLRIVSKGIEIRLENLILKKLVSPISEVESSHIIIQVGGRIASGGDHSHPRLSKHLLRYPCREHILLAHPGCTVESGMRQPDIVIPKSSCKLAGQLNRDDLTIGQSDPPGEIGQERWSSALPPCSGAKIIDSTILEKEIPLLGEEQRKTAEVNDPLINLCLRKIRIVTERRRKARRDTVADICSRVSSKAIPLTSSTAEAAHRIGRKL